MIDSDIPETFCILYVFANAKTYNTLIEMRTYQRPDDIIRSSGVKHLFKTTTEVMTLMSGYIHPKGMNAIYLGPGLCSTM